MTEPSNEGEPSHKKLVFVSHWRDSAEQARTPTKELSDSLEKRGCEFFLAEEHIKPGSEWENTVKEKLRRADAFVVLCSKNTLDRYWVSLEIGAAWVLGKPAIAAGTNSSNRAASLSARKRISREILLSLERSG